MAPVINGRNLYNNLFRNKYVKAWLPDNPAASASTVALLSTVTKDALNCYYYTTQSYHNKKIPEDKRKFVASLDLSNGIVNVLVPLLSKPLIDKFANQTFDKKFSKLFNAKSAESIYQKLKSKNINCDLQAIENILGKTSCKWAKAGFGVIATLVASQIICKRVITPSLATPLADVFKKGFEKHEAKMAFKGKQNEEVSNEESLPNPSVYVIRSNTFKTFDDLITKEPSFQKQQED